MMPKDFTLSYQLRNKHMHQIFSLTLSKRIQVPKWALWTYLGRWWLAKPMLVSARPYSSLRKVSIVSHGCDFNARLLASCWAAIPRLTLHVPLACDEKVSSNWSKCYRTKFDFDEPLYKINNAYTVTIMISDSYITRIL